MRTRFAIDEAEYELTLTTEHAANSYGQPVWVTEDGDAIDQLSAALHTVIEATLEELDAARAYGFNLEEALQ